MGFKRGIIPDRVFDLFLNCTLHGPCSCGFSERTVILEMYLVKPLVCSRLVREAGVCFLISEHVFGIPLHQSWLDVNDRAVLGWRTGIMNGALNEVSPG